MGRGRTAKEITIATNDISKNRKINYDPNKKVTYHVNLQKEEWDTIAPVPVARRDRDTYVLKRGWTDLLINKLWMLHRIPCPFSFKKHQFFVTKDNPYLSFIGKCNECGNSINGSMKNEPTVDSPIIFDIETHDTSDLKHETSTNFAGDRRLREQKILESTKVKKYVDERDADELDDSGTKPPFYVSEEVAHTARQQAKDKNIGIDKYSNDPVAAILELADDDEAIREFSVVPVRVFYWSENQIRLWNEAVVHHIPISIDASGSISKPLNIIDNEKSSAIFIYNIVFRLKNEKDVYSICQMLSSKHDTLTISKWLQAWLDSGALLPSQVTTDCCLALLNAVCYIFNLCYYLRYNDKCHVYLQEYRQKFKRLQNKEEKVVMSCTLPPCRVMRDRAHLIKSACKWKCFSVAQNWVKKDFYVRSIAFSVEIENLDELEKVIKALLVVCQAQFFDITSNCYEQYTYLNEKISTFIHKEPFEYKLMNSQSTCQEEDCSLLREFDSPESVDTDAHNSQDIKLYLDGLLTDSKLLVDEDNAKEYSKVNPYWLPDILKNIVRLYREYPSWTNVTRPHYPFEISPVASSTGSEVYFRILKKDYELIGCSLQRFLLKHLKLLKGATKNGRRKIAKYKSETSKTEDNHNKLEKFVEKNEVTEENEKFLEINVREEHDDPDRFLLNNHIRNGHLVQAVMMGNKQITFANTCGFDSIISIFIHAYKTSSVFQGYINLNSLTNGLFFETIIEYSNQTISMEKFYYNRGLLLMNYQSDKNLDYYNCECNVNTLLSNLMRNQISCEKIVRCELYNHERVERLRLLVVSDVFASIMIQSGNPNVIHDCIVNLFEREELHCRNCRVGERRAFGYCTLGFFFVVDISKVFEDNDLSSANVPVRLNIHGNEFILAGFVVRIPALSENGIAHYVTYCYHSSEDTFEIIDDTKTSPENIKAIPPNLKISTIIYVLNVVNKNGSKNC